MKNLQVVLEKASENKTWDNEEHFLRDGLVIVIAKLLMKSRDEIKDGNLSFIAPLLRQAQESIICLLGITNKGLTFSEFASDNKDVDYKKIMEKIKEENKEIDLKVFNVVNLYLKTVKESLNQFNHSNFASFMTIYMDNHDIYEVRRMNRIVIKNFINLLESPFIIICNLIYGLSLPIEKLINVNKEFSNLSNLKYISNKFSKPTKEFFNNSEAINKYLQSIYGNIELLSKDLKSIQNKKTAKKIL